jgi:SAM-dependent methyltransferase
MAYDHHVGSFLTEADAVRARYARRSTVPDPALPCFLAERERAMRRWMVETGIDPLTARVLEIGCGTGGNLLDLIRFGFAPANLTGIELQRGRLEDARRRLPTSVELIEGDALDVALEPGTFDVVLLFTVFTSLLDDEYRVRLATYVWRVVKPGGGVLWYDFCVDNPRNPDVRGVPVKAIRRLFPEGALHCRRTTLAPPLARAAVRLHSSLYALLNTIPLLRTHVLCWISKSGPVARRVH